MIIIIIIISMTMNISPIQDKHYFLQYECRCACRREEGKRSKPEYKCLTNILHYQLQDNQNPNVNVNNFKTMKFQAERLA